MTIYDIPAVLTGESMFTKFTGDPERPSRHQIARLAYDFWEKGGRQNGREIHDWLAAEEELTRHYR